MINFLMFQKRDIPRPQPPAGPAPTTHNPLHIVEEGDIVKENTPPSTLKQTEIRPTVTRTTSVNSRISSTSKILLRLKNTFHANYVRCIYCYALLLLQI